MKTRHHKKLTDHDKFSVRALIGKNIFTLFTDGRLLKQVPIKKVVIEQKYSMPINPKNLIKKPSKY